MCNRCKGLGGVIVASLIGGLVAGYITGYYKAGAECMARFLEAVNERKKKTES